MIGRSVGNYRLIKRLGQGGMGVVFLAEHPGIGRRAAVKFLHPDLAKNKRLLKRFFNEARAAAAIRHPGIVEVYDFGTAPDGASYITMEFVEGESLGARLARVGKLAPGAAIDLAIQIASALGAVHAKRIIHRDLKPDNLFLTPDPRRPGHDLVKVLDFGIARLDQAGEPSSMKTQTGSVMGTPIYMSPEQCRGKRNIDLRTDVYSLGVVLYEMLCGAPPFVSEGFGELVYLQIGTPPPRPSLRNPAISPELETVLLTMLAKEPTKRTPHMAGVITALGAVGVEPLSAVSSGPGEAPLRREARTTLSSTAGTLETHEPRRGRQRLVASLALLVVVAGGGWLATRQTRTPPPRPMRTSVERVVEQPAPAPRPPLPVVVERSLPVPPPTPRFDPDASIAIAITTSPPGATILDESGQLVDFTPYHGVRTRARGAARLRIEKEGFRPFEVAVPLDRGLRKHFVLKRKAL